MQGKSKAEQMVDAISIIAAEAAKNHTQIYSVQVVDAPNTILRTCTIMYKGVKYSNIPYYGEVPRVNQSYQFFIPQNQLSRAFIISLTAEDRVKSVNLSGNSGYRQWESGETEYWGVATWTTSQMSGVAQIGSSGIYTFYGAIPKADIISSDIMSHTKTAVVNATVKNSGKYWIARADWDWNPNTHLGFQAFASTGTKIDLELNVTIKGFWK